MRTHTAGFKTNIKSLGRQLAILITYGVNTLDNEDINSATYNYKGGILKSVMRQLDLDSNVSIPEGTEINFQYGILVNGSYEYLDYGNFIVNKVEKQEDTNSYLITCYDKMLYAMTSYQNLGLIYPITIRSYIGEICTALGLTFANSSDTFVNYDKEIPSELYLDSNGNDLGYTYRDVLDDLAEVTASTICINDDDELEIRYITDTSDTIDEDFMKSINVGFGEQYGPINTVVLSRSAGADKISLSNPTDLADDLKKAIEIADNQILNNNDRDTYMSDILTQLYGLSYYMNDFKSTGICYYDLCDKYSISIDSNTYSCVMFNDEINITQGLEENVYTDMPEQAEQQYKKMDSTDRRINQTTLIVDKVQGDIQALTTATETLQDQMGNTYTIDQVNQLVQNAETGITNTFSTSGGNNIFRNTGLWFPSSTGENLFNKDRANIINGYFSSNAKITSSSNTKTLYIECKPNTKYVIVKNAGQRFRVIETDTLPAINVTGTNYVYNDTASSLTITTTSTASYICVYYYSSSSDTATEEQMRASITIKEDTSANPYEYWTGDVTKQSDDRASNNTVMLLKATTLSQEQAVPNGVYTISFKYKKLMVLATVSCNINGTSYNLTADTDTEFVQTINITSGSINVQFTSDTAGACEIYDLMVNNGETKYAYSQNQNETTTSTVNISKGISISGSDYNTMLRADADGIRTLDKTSGEVLSKFTDRGMLNKEMVITNQAEIVGVLVQEIDNQTWFTRM